MKVGDRLSDRPPRKEVRNRKLIAAFIEIRLGGLSPEVLYVIVEKRLDRHNKPHAPYFRGIAVIERFDVGY